MHLLQTWGQRWPFQHPSLWGPQVLNAAYWQDGLRTTREILKWIVNLSLAIRPLSSRLNEWERESGTDTLYTGMQCHTQYPPTSLLNLKLSAVAPHASSVLFKTHTVTLIPCHVNFMQKHNQIQKQNTYTDKQKCTHMVGQSPTYSNVTFMLSFPIGHTVNMQCKNILSLSHSYTHTDLQPLCMEVEQLRSPRVLS